MISCSVIIINYNTSQLTVDAVNSVLNHSNRFATEIIVVDNGSKAEDYQNLKGALGEQSRLQLIRSRINLGFGGGNMFGVQQASGEYYAFLNSDAYLQEDSIATMVQFLENNAKVSMVGANSVDENGNLHKAFDHRMSLRNELFGHGFMKLINPKKFPSRKKQLDRPTEVGAVPGSFFICRAADFDAVGGFDTNLFLYYEEKDLSFRIEKHLKKEIFSIPNTTYVHLKGKSTPASYLSKQELKISQFYSVRKNLGSFKYCLFYAGNLLKFLAKAPFSSKNRKYLLLCLRGIPLSESLKHKQPITPILK